MMSRTPSGGRVVNQGATRLHTFCGDPTHPFNVFVFVLSYPKKMNKSSIATAVKHGQTTLAVAAFLLAGATWLQPPSAFLGAALLGVWWGAGATIVAALLLALVARHRFRDVTALGAALVLLLHGFVGADAPDSSEPATSTTLSVLTYNVLFRGGVHSRTLKTIDSAQADVLALQEVTPAWKRRLAAVKGYPYRVVRAHSGTHGLALLSRYPIREVKYLNNQSGLAIAQCADIIVEQTIVALCNAHTASPAGAFYNQKSFREGWERNAQQRARQWRRIVAQAKSRQKAVTILAGDFNTLETEPLYREMTGDFTDLYRAHHRFLGATWPNLVPLPPFPVMRIDYIFGGGAQYPLSAEVVATTGSDHRAVKATVQL